MVWTNRIIAGGLLGLCALLWPEIGRFPAAAADFPYLVLGILAVLSLVLLARSFVPALQAPSTRTPGETGRAMIRPLLVFAAMAASVYLMRFVTFFPAAGAFGCALFFILNVRRRALFALSFGGLMLFVYLVFQVLLGVPLGSARLFGG